MASDKEKQVLRLPKKHSRETVSNADPERGAKLVRMQSARAAITASLIVIIIFSIGWAALSGALGRVFPWMPMVQALLIGIAVRRAGRGLDWRFPSIAASAAILGSVVGNIVVAASTTAAEFGTGTLTVLRAVTEYTWPVFFSEVMTGADFVYAIAAAGIAAYYANRRLTRSQYASYRLWREQQGR